ncbi:MAG: hypothetical protein WBO17_15050 [Sphingorhabdus sp.]
MKTLLAAALLNAINPLPALADTSLSRQASPPERVSFLVTFGEDACPAAHDDEIVVCAPAPESDRYRIPKDLRKNEIEIVSGGSSWTSAVESLDAYSRANLPNSCSVNGSNGFTGCTRAALEQWHSERRSKRNAN